MIHDLQLQRRKNIDSVNPDKGRYKCKNCLDTGINFLEISTYNYCCVCGGHGNVNWIDHLTNGKSRKDINPETQKACYMNNAAESMVLLIDSLSSLGIDLKFSIEAENKKGDLILPKIIEVLERYNLLHHCKI
jgi:hypothetical protein